MEAKDCQCIVCGKQAVAFFPVVDPDIPSYPYCVEHLEEAMIDMSTVLWKDDKVMRLIAIEQAKKAVEKYK